MRRKCPSQLIRANEPGGREVGRRGSGIDVTNHRLLNFHADRPNTRWVTDMADTCVGGQYLYLCVEAVLTPNVMHRTEVGGFRG